LGFHSTWAGKTVQGLYLSGPPKDLTKKRKLVAGNLILIMTFRFQLTCECPVPTSRTRNPLVKLSFSKVEKFEKFIPNLFCPNLLGFYFYQFEVKMAAELTSLLHQ
jgi:hypothetical protein